MSNSDFEDDWVPNKRPQSTLAQSFSAALDDAFNLDADIDGLASSVEQKKQTLNSHQTELEQLEARIREAEERLKASTSRSASPHVTSPSSPPANTTLPQRSPPSAQQNAANGGLRPSALRGMASPAEDDQRRGQVNGGNNRRPGTGSSRPTTGSGRTPTGKGGQPSQNKPENTSGDE